MFQPVLTYFNVNNVGEGEVPKFWEVPGFKIFGTSQIVPKIFGTAR